MKDKTIFILIIIVFVFLVYKAFPKNDSFNIENSPREDETGAIAVGSFDSNKEYQSIVILEETDIYSIKAEYPDVLNEEVEKQLLNIVQAEIDRFKEIFNADPNYPIFEGRKNTLIIEFKVTENSDYESFIFYFITDTGGAHPNSYIKTQTFSKGGEVVQVSDIMKKYNWPSDNLGGILKEKVLLNINEQLEERGSAGWPEDAITSSLSSFSNFYIKGDLITFTYSPYEVGPYALGLIEVIIPLNFKN